MRVWPSKAPFNGCVPFANPVSLAVSLGRQRPGIWCLLLQHTCIFSSSQGCSSVSPKPGRAGSCVCSYQSRSTQGLASIWGLKLLTRLVDTVTASCHSHITSHTGCSVSGTRLQEPAFGYSTPRVRLWAFDYGNSFLGVRLWVFLLQPRRTYSNSKWPPSPPPSSR